MICGFAGLSMPTWNVLGMGPRFANLLRPRRMNIDRNAQLDHGLRAFIPR